MRAAIKANLWQIQTMTAKMADRLGGSDYVKNHLTGSFRAERFPQSSSSFRISDWLQQPHGNRCGLFFNVTIKLSRLRSLSSAKNNHNKKNWQMLTFSVVSHWRINVNNARGKHLSKRKSQYFAPKFANGNRKLFMRHLIFFNRMQMIRFLCKSNNPSDGFVTPLRTDEGGFPGVV